MGDYEPPAGEVFTAMGSDCFQKISNTTKDVTRFGTMTLAAYVGSMIMPFVLPTSGRVAINFLQGSPKFDDMKTSEYLSAILGLVGTIVTYSIGMDKISNITYGEKPEYFIFGTGAWILTNTLDGLYELGRKKYLDTAQRLREENLAEGLEDRIEH